MILIILGGLFLALCLFAALHDVNSLTIPNWLNLTIAALFVPAAVFSGLPIEIIFGHVLAGLAAFVIGFRPLCVPHVFGGGDAKMIPAVMLWIGPSASLAFMFSRWRLLAARARCSSCLCGTRYRPLSCLGRSARRSKKKLGFLTVLPSRRGLSSPAPRLQFFPKR
jgi:hypothetical protein